MARVPGAEGTGYNPFPVRTPEFIPTRPIHIETSPEMFGAGIGRAWEKFGSDLKEVSASMFQAQDNISEQAINDATMDSTTKIDELTNKFAQLNGKDAQDQYPDYAQNIQNVLNDAKSGKSYYEAQRIFKSVYPSVRFALSRGAEHAAREGQAYTLHGIEGQIDMLERQMVGHADSPDLLDDDAKKMGELVVKEAGLTSRDGEWVKSEVQRRVNSMAVKAIEATLSGYHDPAKATRILNYLHGKKQISDDVFYEQTGKINNWNIQNNGDRDGYKHGTDSVIRPQLTPQGPYTPIPKPPEQHSENYGPQPSYAPTRLASYIPDQDNGNWMAYAGQLYDNVMRRPGASNDMGSTPFTENGGGTIGWWNPGRTMQAVNTLMAAGLPQMGAMALVARMAGVEASSGPTETNGVGARGIAQWLPSRGPVPADFEGQLEKVIGELHGPESAAFHALVDAKEPVAAAIAAASFERAEGYREGYGDRFVGKTLRAMMHLFGDRSTPAGPMSNAIKANYEFPDNSAGNSIIDQRKVNGSIDTEHLDPEFRTRLAHAISDAEAATGEKARIVSGWRSYGEQANLYWRYLHGGGLAAPAGRSRHEKGDAVDLERGAVLRKLWEWEANGTLRKYGLEFLSGRSFQKDPVHIQLASQLYFANRRRGLEI